MEKLAQLANAKKNIRATFIDALIKSSHSLQIVAPEKVEKVEEDDEESIPQCSKTAKGVSMFHTAKFIVDATKDPIVCCECKKEFYNPTRFADHVIDHERNVKIRNICRLTQTIPIKSQAILAESLRRRDLKTFIRKGFENCPSELKCSMISPMFKYLGNRDLKVYLGPVPNKPELISVQLSIHRKKHNVHFDISSIQRKIIQLRRQKQQRIQIKEEAKFASECIQQIAIPDIVLKQRTKEESTCLAKALSLPEGFTQDQLMMAISKMDGYKPSPPKEEASAGVSMNGRKRHYTQSRDYFSITAKRPCTSQKMEQEEEDDDFEDALE
ncbi:Protein CBG01922 [Caenorhabditis briggsae]|uniref:C2H2-type domain-containing protein n=2 Tax=Caenorhabditis briggsae TaxID=6238 RepID=A0AAE9CTI3_CAEBR|nr:Protein CBG01922 [Caenorhabditis briggsae]ULT80402.1 hypothetical protein L3Y34_010756 [Caenorhabditis briggsae]CAP23119.1 Protein CBG01922 [Caenorhabditis briggsae]